MSVVNGWKDDRGKRQFMIIVHFAHFQFDLELAFVRVILVSYQFMSRFGLGLVILCFIHYFTRDGQFQALNDFG